MPYIRDLTKHLDRVVRSDWDTSQSSSVRYQM